jgi:hypothetical protein
MLRVQARVLPRRSLCDVMFMSQAPVLFIAINFRYQILTKASDRDVEIRQGMCTKKKSVLFTKFWPENL